LRQVGLLILRVKSLLHNYYYYYSIMHTSDIIAKSYTTSDVAHYNCSS